MAAPLRRMSSPLTWSIAKMAASSERSARKKLMAVSLGSPPSRALDMAMPTLSMMTSPIPSSATTRASDGACSSIGRTSEE